MTDDDAEKLCLWTYEQVENIELSDRDLCELDAAARADSTSECKELVDTCLKDPPAPEPDEGPDCGDASTDELPDRCEQVTVGDYESCMRGIFAALKDAATGVSCAKLGDTPTLEGIADNLPKACDKIHDICPEMLPEDLFDSEDDSEALISSP